MSTRTKIGIVVIATIIGSVCAPIGGILRWGIGPYDLGIPMWGGALVVVAPISGGFFSLVSSLIALKRTERMRTIFYISGVVGFLVGYLPFAYNSF